MKSKTIKLKKFKKKFINFKLKFPKIKVAHIGWWSEA